MEDETLGPTLPGGPAGDTGSTRDQAVQRGASIGPYRLLEVVGEGGMGEVWVAEQTRPVRRKVALKIIRKGMDTDEVVARFEQERQALAMMDHQAIAKVFDAGATPRGRPYFVMEYVPGVPISDYCDQKRLTTQQRLELFIQVCEGVQHAHHKAIIHRDLKPTNVLVTEQDSKPQPKIIDFGVAKATSSRLTDRTMHTELGEMLGTPEYMSPEQAEMSAHNIDTRTDVYSLGVMLYKLLVGELPFDAKELRRLSFDDMRRRIREEEPPRPSTRITHISARDAADQHLQADYSALHSQLRGDLDWIVMKAIEKERARRYNSPAAMAVDIQRYLDNEPIEARPPTALYRMSKFVRRHRVGTTAAAALLVTLIGFAATMAVQANRIARERDRANQEAETARQVSQFMEDLFEVSDPSEARGNTITAREILDQGAAKVEKELVDQPAVQARLMTLMGRVYNKLGLYGQSQPLLERSLAIRGAAPGDDLELAGALAALGSVLIKVGDYDRSREALEKSLDIRERRLGPEHRLVADTLNHFGTLEVTLRNWETAVAPLERSLSIIETTLGPDDPEVARPLNNLGIVYRRLEDYTRSRQMYERALAVTEKAYGADHPDVASILKNIASLLMRMEEYDEARPVFERSLAIREKVLGPEHPEVASLLNNLANLHRALEDYPTSQALHERALAIREKALGEDHPDVAQSLQNLAVVVSAQGRYAEAAERYDRALAILTAKLAPDHPAVALIYYNLAALAALQEKRDRALDLLHTAVERGFARLAIADDTDFEALRGDPEFEAIVAEVQARAAAD